MKAILIVVDEIPQSCLLCDFHTCTNLIVGYPNFCIVHDMDEINIDLDHERENWCPLRPLPEKRNTTSLIETKHEAEENHVTPQHQAGFNLGWNACLEAITGGNHDETEDD